MGRTVPVFHRLLKKLFQTTLHPKSIKRSKILRSQQERRPPLIKANKCSRGRKSSVKNASLCKPRRLVYHHRMGNKNNKITLKQGRQQHQHQSRINKKLIQGLRKIAATLAARRKCTRSNINKSFSSVRKSQWTLEACLHLTSAPLPEHRFLLVAQIFNIRTI